MAAYELNFDLEAPMDYETFCKMPEKWQRKYFGFLRQNFLATDAMIADMMGCHKNTVYNIRRRLGIYVGVGGNQKLVRNDPGRTAWGRWLRGE